MDIVHFSRMVSLNSWAAHPRYNNQKHKTQRINKTKAIFMGSVIFFFSFVCLPQFKLFQHLNAFIVRHVALAIYFQPIWRRFIFIVSLNVIEVFLENFKFVGLVGGRFISFSELGLEISPFIHYWRWCCRGNRKQYQEREHVHLREEAERELSVIFHLFSFFEEILFMFSSWIFDFDTRRMCWNFSDVWMNLFPREILNEQSWDVDWCVIGGVKDYFRSC